MSSAPWPRVASGPVSAGVDRGHFPALQEVLPASAALEGSFSTHWFKKQVTGIFRAPSILGTSY